MIEHGGENGPKNGRGFQEEKGGTRGGNYWQLGNQQHGDLRAEREESANWKCLLGPQWKPCSLASERMTVLGVP